MYGISILIAAVVMIVLELMLCLFICKLIRIMGEDIQAPSSELIFSKVEYADDYFYDRSAIIQVLDDKEESTH